MIFISILLLIIAAFLQAESEFVRYRPWMSLFPRAPWWVENNWDYSGKGKVVDWLMRYPLSFVKDGFHLTKSLSLVALFTAITLGMAITDIIWLNVVILYAIHGVAFNFWYHKWYQNV